MFWARHYSNELIGSRYRPKAEGAIKNLAWPTAAAGGRQHTAVGTTGSEEARAARRIQRTTTKIFSSVCWTTKMLRVHLKCFAFRTSLAKRYLHSSAVQCCQEYVHQRFKKGVSQVEDGMKRRLTDMRQNGGLPRYISDKMHRRLQTLLPPDYVYTRPVGLSFDLITSHLVDKYEQFETLEEKLNFLETITDSELQRLLILVGQKHPNKVTPVDILNNLILECCRRFKGWDAKTLLYTSDILYQVDCAPKLFYRRLISHVSGQWNSLNLSSSEILQLLFYISYLGDSSEQLMLKIENALTASVQDLGTEELSIICSAFFIANRRIKSPELVDWIARRLLQDFDSLPYYQINSALKVLRHASYQNPKVFDALGEKYYEQHKNRHSVSLLQDLMEPLRCYSSLRLYNKLLLGLVCDAFTALSKKKANLDGLRSKDFAYLLWALAVFNYRPDDATLEYLTGWLRTLQEQGDFETYPESLVNGVIALVLMEYFPTDLISKTLQSKSLERIKVLRHLDKYYHLLIIDASTSIECPNYKGFQLPIGFINSVPRSALGKINAELEGRAGLHAVYSALQGKLKDEDHVQCHFILPHFHTASIEIHLDSQNCPMKLPYQDIQRDFTGIYCGLFRSNGHQNHSRNVAVTDELLAGLCGQNGAGKEKLQETSTEPARRIAIEILGWNQVCYNDHERQLATSEIKQRHLRKLGYEVYLIHPEEAHSLEDYNEDHLDGFVDKIIRKLNIQI